MKTGRYKVRWLKDRAYEVIDVLEDESVFQGDIAECEAWIRLREGGYFE